MSDTGGSIIRHRILIVDDAQDNVDMISAFLAEEASAIRGLTQSSQVERVFNEFEPDLMLLDLHMPAPDGLEILRNLRGVRESLGFLPVIVLTGDTGRTARNSALLLGADDFLIKPLDRQEVVLRVRNLLRTRRLYVELAEANRALENRLR